MSLRQSLADWISPTKQDIKQIMAAPGSPVVYVDDAQAQAQTRSVRQIAQYGYIENINVFRSINILADACSAISWDVHTGYGKNKVKQDESHPLDKLLKKPNKEQSGATFIHRLISHWMIAGTMYQFAAFAKGTDTYPTKNPQPPVGLYLLHPMLVEPKTQDGELIAYRYQAGPKYVDYPLWKILPLRFFHPLDELSGLSPVMVAALVVDRQNEGEAWNYSLMKHAARPSGAFVAQGRLGEIPYSELKAEIRRTWGTGKRNAGYPLVLDNGLTYVQMALSPMDVDWNVSDSNAGRKISTAIGVDPLLLNDKEHSTYNNVREARLAMIEMTVIPLMDRIRDEWNNWLCPWYGEDVTVDYDKSEIEILRGNRAVFSQMVSSEWNAGLRSFNESTEELKLGKVENNNDFYKFGPTLFVRKAGIGAWLDQSEQMRGSSAQGLEIANQTRLNPPNNSNNTNNGNNGNTNKPNNGNGNKPTENNPNNLAQLTTKAYQSFHSFKIEEENNQEKISLKMTEAQKIYYEQVNQERDVWADKMSEHLDRYFEEELAALLASFDVAHDLGAAKQALEIALQQHSEALPHVLVPYYLDIAESSKNRVMQETGLKSYGVSVTIHKKDALSDLANYASSHIAGINQTTQEKVNSIFLQAQAENLNVYDVQAMLKQAYAGFKGSRAMTIARTEVLAASNLGGQIAMKETGLPILKMWLATQDSLAREWHAEASGQQTDLNSPYYVNGEELMFPGDTSLGASGSNVINCRCCETYQLDVENLPEETKNFWINQLKFNPYHDAHGRFASGGGLALAPVGQSELPGMGAFNLVNTKPGAFAQPAMFSQGAGAGTFTEPIKVPTHAEPYPKDASLDVRDEYLRKYQKDEISDITSEEIEAIETYTGSGYSSINRALRNGEDLDNYNDDDNYSSFDLSSTVDNLDSALQRNTIEAPIILYRELGPAGTAAIAKKKGKIFTDYGFPSASIDKDYISHFGSHLSIMTINVPAGQHGLYVEPYSSVKGESEFLLPRSQKFKVVEYHKGQHDDFNWSPNNIVVDMLPESEEAA